MKKVHELRKIKRKINLPQAIIKQKSIKKGDVFLGLRSES